MFAPRCKRSIVVKSDDVDFIEIGSPALCVRVHFDRCHVVLAVGSALTRQKQPLLAMSQRVTDTRSSRLANLPLVALRAVSTPSSQRSDLGLVQQPCTEVFLLRTQSVERMSNLSCGSWIPDGTNTVIHWAELPKKIIILDLAVSLVIIEWAFWLMCLSCVRW